MGDLRKLSLLAAATRFDTRDEERPLPTHERVLLIARVALRDPGTLSRDEIRDLASAMITHYAQMGIG